MTPMQPLLHLVARYPMAARSLVIALVLAILCALIVMVAGRYRVNARGSTWQVEVAPASP